MVIAYSAEDIIDKFDPYMIHEGEELCEKLYWGAKDSKHFIVRSAYHVVNQHREHCRENAWQRLWKLRVRSRMLTFL